MAGPSHSSLFEKAITVTPIGSNTYSAYLDPEWCIGKVPHGGYTTSVLYRTASVHFASKNSPNKRGRSPEPIGLQISFLRRTFTGPAVLTVQEIKLGARVSTIHVSLSQQPEFARLTNGSSDEPELEVKVVAYITVSPPELEEGPAVKGTWGLSPPAPSDSFPGGSIDFKSLIDNGYDGAWAREPKPDPALIAAKHLEIFSPKSTLSVKTLEDHAKMVVYQWTRFTPGGELARWSNEAVLYLADMFPAALGRMGAMETSRQRLLEREGKGAKSTGNAEKGPFWYPSVTVNIDLKTRLPPEGVEWLHTRVVTRMLRGSRADLDVLILDQKGELVATSSQVALVVDASRNLKGRENAGKL